MAPAVTENLDQVADYLKYGYIEYAHSETRHINHPWALWGVPITVPEDDDDNRKVELRIPGGLYNSIRMYVLMGVMGPIFLLYIYLMVDSSLESISNITLNIDQYDPENDELMGNIELKIWDRSGSHFDTHIVNEDQVGQWFDTIVIAVIWFTFVYFVY